MMMKTWYVEIQRETQQFGYVVAETRNEAIRLMSVDGEGSKWRSRSPTIRVIEAFEYTPKLDVEPGAIEILQ